MVKIATNYPGASDVFNVPTSPTTTPLSSAGSGSRNHVSHHRDLGDAVMALQNNVTKSDHTHSGSALNGPKLVQAYTHESPDTDSTPLSLHHTLGTGANQAAAGNHNHDTRYIRLDGSVAQTVTGKKTFPSGSTAIAIPDFQNSIHNHMNAANGGPASVAAGLQAQYGDYDVGGNLTQDQWLQLSRFTIPANINIVGWINIQYLIGYFPPEAGKDSSVSNVFFYVTINEGESPAYTQSKNVISNGSSFNGTMIQKKHWFSGTGQDMRIQADIPIYVQQQPYDRPNAAFLLRITNVTSTILQGVNWSMNLHYATRTFIS